MKNLMYAMLFCLALTMHGVVWLYYNIFVFFKIIEEEKYVMYTPKKGWVDVSKATDQDFKEVSELCPVPIVRPD